MSLVKKKRKMFFFLLWVWVEEKTPSPHDESTADLRILRPDVLQLSPGTHKLTIFLILYNSYCLLTATYHRSQKKKQTNKNKKQTYLLLSLISTKLHLSIVSVHLSFKSLFPFGLMWEKMVLQPEDSFTFIQKLRENCGKLSAISVSK